jgi:periplasmic protein TonB
MNKANREVALWVFSAAAILAAHGGIAAAIGAWASADAGGAPSAVMVEMAPIASEAAAEHANLPIAPLQEEQTEPDLKPEVQKEPDKVEPEPEPVPDQKVAELPPEPLPPLPPTPPVSAEVTLPPEVKEVKKPPPPKKKVAIATAPERAEKVAPRQRPSQAGAASISPNVMQSYASNIIRPHLMRHISSIRANGVVIVTFTITKHGRLTAHRVSRSSGHSEVDSAALATLQRAQPYPPPPAELANQASFSFTLPLRYN